MELSDKQRKKCLNPALTKHHLHYWCYAVLVAGNLSVAQAETCSLIAGLSAQEQYAYQVVDDHLLKIPTNVVNYYKHPVDGWVERNRLPMNRPSTYNKSAKSDK
jgi:hypothetical protein